MAFFAADSLMNSASAAWISSAVSLVRFSIDWLNQQSDRSPGPPSRLPPDCPEF